MKNLILLFLLCVFVIISCKENGNSPTTGTVSGVVLNSKDNSPISDVFISTEPATETLTSNSTGKFTISNLSAGDYKIVASKSGFKTNSVSINVKNGITTKATILLNEGIGTDTTSDLVAYWSFDDETANDNSGNGYHGTLMNSTSFIQGKKGKGIHFWGNNDYSTYPDNPKGDFVKLPMIPFSQMSEFTISMWVKEEVLSSSYGEFYISFGSAESGLLGIGDLTLQRFADDKELFNQFWVGGNGALSSLYYSSSLYNKNGWVHFVLTYKSNLMKGYINGQLIGIKVQSVSINGEYGSLASHYWNYNGDKRTSASFTGSIDEVKIYRKELSESEVLGIYQK